MKSKVVINGDYGGFGLSEIALEWIGKHDSDLVAEDGYSIPRHHPLLAAAVEVLGDLANGECASLMVVEIPGNQYFITEYDGVETLHTPYNIEWTTATLKS